MPYRFPLRLLILTSCSVHRHRNWPAAQSLSGAGWMLFYDVIKDSTLKQLISSEADSGSGRYEALN